MQTLAGPATIELLQGDITRQQVDAIVNAANSSLLGGGGVDGAIHHAAGPELERECQNLHGCKTGNAKITRGYNLPAKHVIHAVGPYYRDGQHGEADLLASAYHTSLVVADRNHLESVAFPAISAGIYGYPLAEAASIALGTTYRYLTTEPTGLRLVRFVLFTPQILQAFEQVLATIASSK